ncbi:lipopolysaccharide biosynthesis protein [Hyphomicrobium sp.]|jgi:PST family polysaccharide transporter|uniref:lipopolysaccharide biosynthesis protein n=1 Tax=Hyphomicrobium sp. TaxID=82 RepID=UPI002CBF52A8|nr:lipopolysaccharide biosynthesis protein [Hyphomicrobium sp.]HVZ05655.1 lipopolysaccharide biosynthesis protein [Hyphomicrobium sp.]
MVEIQNPVPSGTRGEAAKHVFFMGAAQAWRVAAGFAFTVITARLLAPSDFGLIAMAATVTALVTMIQDLGTTQAVIQRDKISQGQLNSLFWIATCIACLLAMLLAVCAPAIARFFHEPRLKDLTIAFAAPIIAGGVQAIPFALLNRHMRFAELALIDALAMAASLVVGIWLAWQFASYWALYAAACASALVTLVGCWIRSGFRPGKPDLGPETRAMIGFGSGVSGFNLANYLSRNADKLLIGKFFGDTALGFYDRAYRLLLFPLSQIHAPIGRVMIPMLSRLLPDPQRYKRAYMECVSILLLGTQPAILFATIYSEDVFRILLGERWLSSAPIFAWLGIAGLQQVMTSTIGWLYISQGRGGGFFQIGLFGAVTTVAAFVGGLHWGPVGVAAAYTISDYLVRLPVIWAATGRAGPVTTRDLYIMALPHALATVVAAAVLVTLKPLIKTPDILACGCLVSASYAVYVTFLLLFPEKRAYLFQNAEFIRARFAR